MAGFGRLPPIAPHNLIVRFLRNGNHYPDSGRSHVALHESVADPKRKLPDITLTHWKTPLTR
jgi:hypothetical protein